MIEMISETDPPRYRRLLHHLHRILMANDGAGHTPAALLARRALRSWLKAAGDATPGSEAWCRFREDMIAAYDRRVASAGIRVIAIDYDRSDAENAAADAIDDATFSTPEEITETNLQLARLEEFLKGKP